MDLLDGINIDSVTEAVNAPEKPYLEARRYLAVIKEVESHLNEETTSLSLKVGLVVNDAPAAEMGTEWVWDTSAPNKPLNHNYAWLGRVRDGSLVVGMKQDGSIMTTGAPAGIQFMKALGIKDGNLKSEDVIGRQILVDIKHEEYQGQLQARVARWVAYIRGEEICPRLEAADEFAAPVEDGKDEPEF